MSTTSIVGFVLLALCMVVYVTWEVQAVRAALALGRRRWSDVTRSDAPRASAIPPSVWTAGVLCPVLVLLEPLLIGACGGGLLIVAFPEMRDGSRGAPLMAVFAIAFLASVLLFRRASLAGLAVLAFEQGSARAAKLHGTLGVIRHAAPLVANAVLAGPTLSTALAAALYAPLFFASLALLLAGIRVSAIQGADATPAVIRLEPRARLTPAEVRGSALVLIVLAAALMAFNVLGYSEDGRYRTLVFPACFAFIYAGVVFFIRGREAHRFNDAPLWLWVVLFAGLAASMGAGLLANGWVFGR